MSFKPLPEIEVGGSAEKTAPEQRIIGTPFKPGQSGNPLGRPKGSRNKLGEAFVEALHDDFLEHGKAVIEAVRAEKPDQYLKVIAAILPKELHIKDASLDDMSDDELIDLLAAVRSLTATDSRKAIGAGDSETSGNQGVRGKPN